VERIILYIVLILAVHWKGRIRLRSLGAFDHLSWRGSFVDVDRRFLQA